MPSIVELAREMHAAIISQTRDSGETFLLVAPGSPQWMTDAVKAAHNKGEMMPDDTRYEYIHDSLERLIEVADEDPDATYRDLVEAGQDWEPDCYQADLLKWVGSHGMRWWYCDQVMSEGTSGTDFSQIIRRAQVVERCEVYNQLLGALEFQAD